MKKLLDMYTWAIHYIKYFDDNETYNHLAAIEGTQNRKQAVYEECEKFITEIEKLTNDFKAKRDDLIAWGGGYTEESLYK